MPLIGALVLLLTTAGLLASAGLVAASLRLSNITAYALATYVIAWAELVGLVAVLSVAHVVLRWTLVAGVAVLLLAAVVVWSRAGRRRPPAFRPALCAAGALLLEPAAALLAAAVALGFCYVLALALFTPPNTIDALWYHLPRAAIWLQQHRVGYIPDASDGRLNGNPPVAEIGVLYTMAVSGVDRFVTLVSLSAYVALPVGVFALARRLGVELRAALLGALVFATLPVLLLEASTAKNDLVLAAFGAICVYFALGTRTREHVLAGVAFALALGTKIFAPLFLPILGLIVLVAVPRRRMSKLLAVAVPAIVVGATWNVINLVQTGSASGDLSDKAGGSGASGLIDFVPISVRYLIDFAEAPGAAGWWIVAYVAAAIAVAALLFRRPARPRAPLVAAALVAALPFVAIVVGHFGGRAYRYVLFALDQGDLGIFDYDRSVFRADPMTTYFGPLGLALLLSPLVVVYARRELPRVFSMFALAPVVLVVEIALFVGYSNTSGRFYVFAVALATAACSVFLSSRPVTWAVVALAVPTVFLTLRANIEKPPSVWGKARWRVQTLVGPHNEENRLIEFAATSLPRRAHVGLALDSTDISYPFFDSRLERRVRFVSSTQSVPATVDWLVLAPRKPTPRGAWRVVVRTPGGWRLYERA